MATVVQPPTAIPDEQRIVLNRVSWETYERLLADHTDRRVPRFAYDRGVLEIVSPGLKHERDSGALALLVQIVAAVWSIRVLNAGSMTYKREDLQQGIEPDESFYVQHEASVRDKDRIDPSVDPPPDLVIEVDVTHPSLDKLPIFARLGVPEVWRCVGGRVTVLTLVEGAYRESERSLALPLLTGEAITRLLAERRSLPPPEWIWALADWARAAGSADGSTR
jgi:Uma2 family endonuclease